MDEQEFDALLRAQPFGTEDAKRVDSLLRRCTILGRALWGKTPEDLQRQLIASHPEIPAGFALADFQELQRRARAISASFKDPRFAWAAGVGFSSQTILVGSTRFTSWEARTEIVRRAIEHLEKK